jgi:Holliday junction resolvase
MSSYSQGYRVETEWKLVLEDRGHIVTRIAGSGRPENPYDLHSTDREGGSYLWEVKSTGGNAKYFSPEELARITDLCGISERQRIQAFVVVKFKKRRRGFRQFVVVRRS